MYRVLLFALIILAALWAVTDVDTRSQPEARLKKTVRGRLVPTIPLKARSSSVERCHHMAEVSGSIPSRAYQPYGM